MCLMKHRGILDECLPFKGQTRRVSAGLFRMICPTSMCWLMRPALLILSSFLFAVDLNPATSGASYGLFKSVDQGRSWSRSDQGLPGGSRINAIGSVGAALFSATDSGLYRSNDAGQHWHPVAGAAGSSLRILSLASLGTNGFAGTESSGILRSVDGGGNWDVLHTFSPQKVRSLLAWNGRLFVGTERDGVVVSEDSGRSWVSLSSGLPRHKQVFALAVAGGRVYAALYTQGLFALNASQDSWLRIGNVLPLALASSQGSLVAGHNPGGLHWSGDGGTSWSRGEVDGPWNGSEGHGAPMESGDHFAKAPVWELAANDHLVLAGAAAGTYISENHGRTWVRSQSGLPEQSPGIAFMVKPDLLLAAVYFKAGLEKFPQR